MIDEKHKLEIIELKEEILLAKRILKDPGLSAMATKKFHGTVDKENEAKIVVKGAVIHDIIEHKIEAAEKEFECELEYQPTKKMLPGTTLAMNKDIPASALTRKMQFQKLNFTQFTPNTIKIRQNNMKVYTSRAPTVEP